MDYGKTAKEIFSLIGGKENLTNISHCATRLRFNLVDSSGVDKDAVAQVDGVVSVVDKAGQFQIIIGLDVEKVYIEFEKLVGKIDTVHSPENNKEKASILNTYFEQFA